MTEHSLQELEAALLKEPFNAQLRLQYATALLGAGDSGAAVEQFGLVVQQNADSAPGLVGLARAKLAQGEMADAHSSYVRAKNLEDFVADEELDALAEPPERAAPRLQAVQGNAEVMPFQRPAGEDTPVMFTDVAGMAALKKLLKMRIIEPFRNPGLFQRFRKKAGGGVLLYGPPGCGKTLIARAIAGECKAQFISVGISDVLSSYLGESERNLAAIFERARVESPTVLFFDELDALAYSRSKTSTTSTRTVVNEFLAQLDGFAENNDGVLVLAATNMPWDVDSAMKRPGRFSRQVFVPPPDTAARSAMLVQKLEGVPHAGLEFDAIAKNAENYSGADIDGLIDFAKESVLAEIISGADEREISMADFALAFEELSPSTIDWLKTARNLVKFSGADNSYKDVGKYLKTTKLL